MKRTLIRKLPLSFLFAMFFLQLTAQAQPLERLRAARFLNRTSVVLLAAQKQLQAGKIYTGDLARAVAHQRFARKLFFTRRFIQAIYHSRRARMLAFNVIRINRGVLQKDYDFNAQEAEYSKSAPSDKELDQQVGNDSDFQKDADKKFENQSLEGISVDE
jgi:hypothetical protein